MPRMSQNTRMSHGTCFEFGFSHSYLSGSLRCTAPGCHNDRYLLCYPYNVVKEQKQDKDDPRQAATEIYNYARRESIAFF